MDISLLKNKIINTNKNKKIKIFSFINNILLDIYLKHDIDIYRFDLFEFSCLYGYKDVKVISDNEILPLLKNIKTQDKLIAVDLPLTLIVDDNNKRMKNILKFYDKSNADILCIDIDYIFNDVINNLKKIDIPVIVFAKHDEINEKEKHYFDKFLKRLQEIEITGAGLIILENYPENFINTIKNSLSIPVVTRENRSKSNGIYCRFSTDFGFDIINNKDKYFNISAGIDESLTEYLKKF